MSDHEIEIFGQKISYPKDKHGAISVFAVGIVIVAVSWIALVPGGSTTNSLAGHFSAGGTVDGKGLNTNIYQIQFWTPSEKTVLLRDDPKQMWQANVLKGDVGKQNNLFGDKLTSNNNVTGYRRFEVYGKGRGDPKYGYWWILTVSKDYKVRDFVKEYQDYWQTTDSVYVEVMNYEGDYK